MLREIEGIYSAVGGRPCHRAWFVSPGAGFLPDLKGRGIRLAISMKLNESHGQPSIVSTEGGLVGRLLSGSLTPVPYVCPECRRTLLYAEA
jgi:hypothetical protein